MDSTTKKIIFGLILPLALLLTAVLIGLHQAALDFRLHAKFEDNFTLIRTYKNTKVVIDGGPDDKVLSELGNFLPFYDRDIDLLVLTKVDSKHVSGLVDILKRYKVKQVLIPSSSANFGAYWEFLDLVKEKNIKKTFMQEGERFWLDDKTVFDIYSVNPFSGKLSFGTTQISFPDEQNQGEVVSDGTNLAKP